MNEPDFDPLGGCPDTIRRALTLMFGPDDVVELRAINVEGGGTVSGYYDNAADLVRDALQLTIHAEAVWVTLNPVHPDLMARSQNKPRKYAKNTTQDRDILRRQLLLIDCDKERPAGISANEDEHEAALARARQIRGFLYEQGWPDPIYADSGNGGHLLYRIDLPNDAESKALIEDIYAALGAKFGGDGIKIDPANANAARCCKLYGTLARKGDHTEARPHRLTRIIEAPAELAPVTLDALQRVAALKPPPAPRKTRLPLNSTTPSARTGRGDYTTLDVVAWFQAHGHYGRDLGGGKHAVLCPWSNEHSDNRGAEHSDTVIYEDGDSGWPGFHCSHGHCAGRKIKAVMELWGDQDAFCARPLQPSGVTWKAGSSAPAEPQVDPEALYEQLGAAGQPERAALIVQIAEAVCADPVTADGWGQRLKEAGFLTKTTFHAACKAAEKRQKKDARERARQARAEQAAARHAALPDHSENPLPKIDAADQDLPQITSAAWNALQLANEPPSLFRHGTLPSRIESDDHGHPIIKELTEARCRHALARAAYWYAEKEIEPEVKIEVPAMPPKSVVQDVLATPDMPLPVLTRIVESPVFAADGHLQTEPGYHPASRTYYQPAEGFKIRPVSANPTETEQKQARELFVTELLGDFPFTSDAETAHAVALLLQPFARAFIRGATPLYLFEKPSPGTGATLLVDMLTFPALGHSIAAMTEGGDDDEWRKRITAKLLTGSPFVLIDNLRRKLDSGVVAAAITSMFWEDRRLGGSEMVKIPVSCAWVATGNNPSLSDEISRRTVRIRLDAQMDKPWLREEFRHKDLRGWAEKNRAELVWAALTIISAWVAAGKPSHEKPLLGQFESWSHVMGGILAHAGISGFLTNLDEFYEESNSEADLWRQLILAWWERHGDQEMGVAEIFGLIGFAEIPFDFGGGNPQSHKIKFGLQLKAMRDRQFTFPQKDEQGEPLEDLHLRVRATRVVRRAQRWVLRQIVKVTEGVSVGSVGECSQPPRMRLKN